MRSRREQRRQQGEVGARSPRGDDFHPVMRRGGPNQPPGGMAVRRSAVGAIGLPSDRQPRRAGEDQHQPPCPCDPPHTIEQRPAPAGRRRMVAKHDPRAARQLLQRAPQAVALALVGHQPKRGQGGLAAAHRRIYSGAMPNPEASAALTDVRDRIAHAAALAGRQADAVELVAISKTYDADAVRPLIAAGQRVFGENRVQEAQAKWPVLRAETPDLRLHLVGQLQSNKADDAVALFDAIHSLDRPSLVAALARAMDRAGRRPDCFVQVNIGDEPQKGGCAIANLPALLAAATAAGLPVIGLMAVPPADTEPAPYFALLAKLARDHGLAGLSIGMSGDFETAVMIGATHVRVGSALFGARQTA